MRVSLKIILVSLFFQVLGGQAAIMVTNISPGCMANGRLFLMSDGSLWGMGNGGFGPLGNVSLAFHPEQFFATGYTAMAAGAQHALLLKTDGSLWGIGNNSYGALGDGAWTSTTNQPGEIISNGVTAIATGANHSLFLKSDGSLWAMGHNSSGELGDGTFTPNPPFGIYQPEEIVTNGVTVIAAGAGHSLFLKSDGSLWVMGDNTYGQLGDGIPQSIFPYATNQPEQIVASGVTAIAGGLGHTLFLKSDGSLWGMGMNRYGQLGGGTYSNGTNQPEEIVAGGVVAIATGQYHSLFLKTDGSLWAMGWNEYGQLGDGTYDNTNQPEQIVAGGVIAIAAGIDYSVFAKSDGTLWGMGNDADFQLSDGFYGSAINATPVPEQILPRPQPILTQTVSNADLQFTASCGFGGNYYLLAATNLAQPLSEWTQIYTNIIIYRNLNIFSATLSNAVNFGNQQFFILQSP